MKYRVASLFSGVGGFEEGLNSAKINYEIVFASEIDKYARLTYSQNFDDTILHGDIKNIDEKDIPDHDILCAGFPCQTFSIAGRQKGFEDTRGTLFFDIARIVKKKEPDIVLLENVKNLISHNKGETFKVILKVFNNLGYCVDFDILNSKDFSVPQNRERIYILCCKNSSAIEKYKSFSYNKKVNNLKLELNKKKFKSFNFFNTIKIDNYSKQIIDVIIKDVEEKYYMKENVQNFVDIIDSNSDIFRENKIIKLLDIPKEIHNDNERQRRVYSIYGISPTILARMDSPKIIYNNRIRKTTPIENFYIQGFSNEFISNIENGNMSDTQLYKQSGNAVSPPVIKQIFDTLLEEGYLKYD